MSRFFEMAKLTIPDVIPMIREYYKTNPVGGSLHIVLDDYNWHPCHVRWCKNYATEEGDTAGAALADMLLLLSKTQLRKLARRGGWY